MEDFWGGLFDESAAGCPPQRIHRNPRNLFCRWTLAGSAVDSGSPVLSTQPLNIVIKYFKGHCLNVIICSARTKVLQIWVNNRNKQEAQYTEPEY